MDLLAPGISRAPKRETLGSKGAWVEKGMTCPILGLFVGAVTLETPQLFTALGIYGGGEDHQDQSLVKLPGVCKDTEYSSAVLRVSLRDLRVLSWPQAM